MCVHPDHTAATSHITQGRLSHAAVWPQLDAHATAGDEEEQAKGTAECCTQLILPTARHHHHTLIPPRRADKNLQPAHLRRKTKRMEGNTKHLFQQFGDVEPLGSMDLSRTLRWEHQYHRAKQICLLSNPPTLGC